MKKLDVRYNTKTKMIDISLNNGDHGSESKPMETFTEEDNDTYWDAIEAGEKFHQTEE